jgi:hypothetical protein
MRHRVGRSSAVSKMLTCVLVVVGLPLATSTSALAQAWQGYARDARHSATSTTGSQYPDTIRWSTPVDLAPQYTNGNLFIHYGSPMITSQNVVLVPVKTAATGGFRLESHRGSDGALLWKVNSDYILAPGSNWTPSWGPTLVPNDAKVIVPAAGGTLLSRTTPNSGHGNLTRIAFYNLNYYKQNPGAFNSAVYINTPVTSDGSGNIYFGYIGTTSALPGYPNGIPSGLARISSTGAGTFASAASLSGDNGMNHVVFNCAPAVTADGSSVYVAVSNGNFGNGYLCKLNSTTLARQASITLKDPQNNYASNALIPDDGTSSPTIGPDGDVYFGVLEANFPNHNDRGWMLHFDAGLTTRKIPGSFGWDNTASIVPASAVPSYSGGSAYLILTKYNNYAGFPTGDGQNKLAVLDPFHTQPDPIFPAVSVMKEVITVLGHTHEGSGYREWCVNTAAIDPVNKCAVVNSEDGNMYRWDFVTNTLSPPLNVALATGEAYTPTLIGPDGANYVINNAALYCCVSSSGSTHTLHSEAAALHHFGEAVGGGKSVVNGVVTGGDAPEKEKSKR